MKSRLPPSMRITVQQQKAIREQVEIEMVKQAEERTRILMKLMCYVFNREYGFGKQRLTKACTLVSNLCVEHAHDEAFWEHLDRVIIDEIGMEFERESP